MFKKIAALFLVMLFVSVQLVKLLHSHSIIGCSYADKEIIKAGTLSDDCSICDYHFAKDKDLLNAEFEIKALLLTGNSLAEKPCTITSSIGSVATDRGPPATT